MSRARLNKGARGEQIAVEYLQKLGYEILHRNLRLSHLEIDIVCRDRQELVFVEVKYALSDKFGHPATWIDQRKQEKLREAARLFVEKYGSSGLGLRFDAITITKGEVEHYPNAF
jgi:putative endonuclease